MKKIILLILLTISTNVFSGNELYFSGNELAEMMVEYEKDVDNLKSAYMAGQYYAYVIGVLESTNGIIWCNPGNVTNGQLNKIVSKYLHNNPEKLHFYANSLVTQALKEALPCKK